MRRGALLAAFALALAGTLRAGDEEHPYERSGWNKTGSERGAKQAWIAGEGPVPVPVPVPVPSPAPVPNPSPSPSPSPSPISAVPSPSPISAVPSPSPISAVPSPSPVSTVPTPGPVSADGFERSPGFSIPSRPLHAWVDGPSPRD